MSDVKLFYIKSDSVKELKGYTVKLEKTLQSLIEKHIETLLGVKFVASEYSTGRIHSGRIDTLGLDEDGCPIIIEYKRHTNVNVVNQGLFYLDWLMDHQAEFELLVLKKFGKESADKIDWSAPRLLCLAEGFTRYDIHAIQQINRNIELIRYMLYDEDLLLLNLINTVVATPDKRIDKKQKQHTKQVEPLDNANSEPKKFYEDIREYILELGDDIQEKELKFYIAFKRFKNFACVYVKKNSLIIWLKIDPDTVTLEEGFSRDVRKIGHVGTGDFELTINNEDALEKSKPLIKRSFEES